MNFIYKKLKDLEIGLEEIISSPKQTGIVKMIVSRPKIETRKILKMGELDKHLGLIGDNWYDRDASSAQNKSPDMQVQITIMNSRVIELITQNYDQWSLAGDQLYIEMDISKKNLPPGSLLEVGSALLKVSEKPHTGCKKFSERFGLDALKFISSKQGRELSLRGINTSIIKSGIVQTGDKVMKVDHEINVIKDDL